MAGHDRKTVLGGKKKLTLIDTIAQSVGLMGPVFSIAFLVPLLVGLNASGNGAGNAAALAVIIAAVGVVGLGWLVAEYTRKIQAAGSLYDYVTDGLGGRVGSAAGWLYYTGMLALGAGILPMIGGVIHDTVQSEFHRAPLPYIVWDLLLFLLVGTILFMGVALSTRTQLTLALISVSVVLVFTGFETSANLGEATEPPHRNIPRAVLISVLTIAGFYVVGAFAQIAGYHFNIGLLAKNAVAPLFGLAGPASQGGYASVGIRRLVELVVVLDMIAVLIGCAVSASRGVFALARDRRMPGPLTRISRHGTPSGASTFVLFVYLIIIMLVATTTSFALPGYPEYASMFTWMSTYGGFAIAVIYLMIAVGSLRGLRSDEKRWQLYAASLVGGVVTAGAIFGAVYKVTAPLVYAPYAAVVILILGLIAASMVPQAPSGTANFSGLSEAEQGPIKL